MKDMSKPANGREALTSRTLPEMTLSDGSASSLTGPTPPMPVDMSAQERALERFAVKGNAVITGGAGALALEAARSLLEHGVSGLALLDINPSQAERSISRLRTDFPNIRIISILVNVTDVDSVTSAIAMASSQLGSVDILACFAGIVDCKHTLEIRPDEWRRTLDINTTGAFLCAQAAAQQMRIQQTPGGRIIFVASISAHRVNFPQPQVAYNVSKCALLQLARSLAAEWAVYGITVNTLSPGYMDTILNEGTGIERAKEIWCERNPMGRIGTPSELTGPLVLLCSRFGGAFITGADLVVDGGAVIF